MTFHQLVARFAQEQVLPKVQKMDETEKLDADVLKGLFEQGVSVYILIIGSGNRGNYFFLVFPRISALRDNLGRVCGPNYFMFRRRTQKLTLPSLLHTITS